MEWTRVTLLSGLFFLAALGLAAQQPADAILGTYMTEGGKAKIVVSKQGTRYIGTLVWTRRGDVLDSKNPDKAEAQKKLVGKVILHDLQHDEDADYKGGKIYDPDLQLQGHAPGGRQPQGARLHRGVPFRAYNPLDAPALAALRRVGFAVRKGTL